MGAARRAPIDSLAPPGSVDHIHTIYRDPTNDYGAKVAK